MNGSICGSSGALTRRPREHIFVMSLLFLFAESIQSAALRTGGVLRCGSRVGADHAASPRRACIQLVTSLKRRADRLAEIL